ncbi:hypothetical protein IEQ34_003745 [Dendrobium chrysotoxum]|uniref:Uncharacterized protein n=1 Tax=Dendrobium chrysotoxum TaxID=161865 RepID=A0AAV7HDX9_DENCH|nr:hypothetical protein IEQ34_003745 [Dendrobium chrysotoxum]
MAKEQPHPATRSSYFGGIILDPAMMLLTNILENNKGNKLVVEGKRAPESQDLSRYSVVVNPSLGFESDSYHKPSHPGHYPDLKEVQLLAAMKNKESKKYEKLEDPNQEDIILRPNQEHIKGPSRCRPRPERPAQSTGCPLFSEWAHNRACSRTLNDFVREHKRAERQEMKGQRSPNSSPQFGTGNKETTPQETSHKPRENPPQQPRKEDTHCEGASSLCVLERAVAGDVTKLKEMGELGDIVSFNRTQMTATKNIVNSIRTMWGAAVQQAKLESFHAGAK